LQNFSGLHNLQHIDGDFTIDNNGALYNFIGLESLNSVGGDLYLKNDEVLNNFDGMEHLTQVHGSIAFNGVGNISSFEGLRNLKSIGESIFLFYWPNIHTLQGFRSLKTVGSTLRINGLNQLEDLQGLNSLCSVKQLIIESNSKLKNLSGLDSLYTITGNLSISNNDSLIDLTGINSLRSAYNISIENNPQLTSFKGFKSLARVGNDLSIINNDNLINLYGFEKLSKVGQYLMIFENQNLESLDGINAIQVESGIRIRYNPNLTVCQTEEICNRLAQDGYTGVSIFDNGPNCNSNDEVKEGCQTEGYYHPKAFPMIEESPQWNILTVDQHIPHIGSTQEVQYGMNTVMCGKRYSKVWVDGIRAYIRSNDKKTYYRRTENCDSKEYLLYDYSLNVGDTAWLGWNQYDWIAKDTAAFVLTSIDSINIYQHVRKVLKMEYADDDQAFSGSLHWIHGIGSTTHPFYPYGMLNDGLLRKYALTCYYTEGEIRYHNNSYPNCNYNYTDLDENDKNTFSISPNPFNNTIKITSNNIEIKEIKLYSITGQLIPIEKQKYEDITILKIDPNLPNGVYMIQVFTEDKVISKKIIRTISQQ
jgi:flagellar basal body rod protein FlgG